MPEDDLGTRICGDRPYARIEPVPTPVRLFTHLEPLFIELLFRSQSDERASLARLRTEPDGPYRYVSTDRLIVGLGADTELAADNTFGRVPLGAKLEAPPLPGLISLGNNTFLFDLSSLDKTTLDSLADTLGLADLARPLLYKAPGLTFLSALQSRDALPWAALPGDLALLRYSAPDRLVTLAPEVARPKPGASLLSAATWGLYHSGGAAARLGGHLGDEKVLVSVVDTGLSIHTALNRISWTLALDSSNPKAIVTADHTTQPGQVALDRKAHGTMVAGLIASEDYGVAPKTSLIPVKVFGDDGCAWTSGIAAGIHHAAALSRILACAWAFDFPDISIQNALRCAKNSLLIFPAGDKSRNLDKRPLYPPGWCSLFSNLLVVGGVSDQGAWVSNYGPATVGIAAPSLDIKTTDLSATLFDFGSGTSLAVGYCAGAAALLLARGTASSAASLGQTLRTTARLRGSYASCGGNGTGILDVAHALGLAQTRFATGTLQPCPP